MQHSHKDGVMVYMSIVLAIFVVTIFSKSLLIIGREQVANVSSIGANITETPANKLAMELNAYSNELRVRESVLNERERVLLEEEERVKHLVRNTLLGTISLSLIILFAMNIYIHRRDKMKNKSLLINPEYSSFRNHIGRKSYQVNLNNTN